jgi:hypothetical protein
MKTLLLTLVLGLIVVASGCKPAETTPPAEVPATNAPAAPAK